MAKCVNCGYEPTQEELEEMGEELCPACGQPLASRELDSEEIKQAMERYPGMPLPLAVTGFMLDREMETGELGKLAAGMAWGGVHLERVGQMVQKMAEAMYHQQKKSITITIEAQDFPDTWDHIWLAIKDVQGGTQEEMNRMGLAGWPCCSCDEIIKGNDTLAQVLMLDKKAKWDYPVWGNFLTGERLKAAATQCGQCVTGGAKPLYAIRKDGEKYIRVPISELEDAK